MKLSVITCCWNSASYIDECIASVRRQVGVEIESVFVDGGSTDGTLEKIQALPSESTRWVTDVRGGISNAMNVGVELATGDFIAHLHADDYFLGSDRIAAALDLIDSSGMEWGFGRIVSDIDGRQVMPTWSMPVYSFNRLLRRNIIAHPAVLMKRSLFLDLGGFDADLKYAMDYDLWLRAAARSAPLYVDSYLAAFRRHAGSTSTANFQKAFLEDHEVRRKYIGRSPAVRLMHEALHIWRKWKLSMS